MSTTRIDLKTTIAAQVVMIVFLLLTTVGVAQESLSNDQLQSLPTHVRDYVFPELKVLERTVEKQSELGIIATFRNEHGFPLFNPFGISRYGRPYQIILIDSRWNRVGTVVESTDARPSIPPESLFVGVGNQSIIGQCYWVYADCHLAPSRRRELARFPIVPEGRYWLMMLVSQRAVTGSVFQQGFPSQAVRQALWKEAALDTVEWRSNLVAVDVDAKGIYSIPEMAGQVRDFSELTAICTSATTSGIEIQSLLINPEQEWYANPFFLGQMGPFIGPVRVAFDLPDKPVPEFINRNGGWSGKAFFPSVRSCLKVPQDGILGTVSRIPGPIPKGTYRLHTEISASVKLKHGMIHRNPESIGEPFKSPVIAITVSE